MNGELAWCRHKVIQYTTDTSSVDTRSSSTQLTPGGAVMLGNFYIRKVEKKNYKIETRIMIKNMSTYIVIFEFYILVPNGKTQK